MPRRNVFRLACLALLVGCNGPDPASAPKGPPRRRRDQFRIPALGGAAAAVGL